MIDMESIAKRFKETRTTIGLSQEELGMAIGVKKQTISAIERGATKKPEYDTIEKAAKKMGVDSKWLMHGKGPREILMERDRPKAYSDDSPVKGYVHFGLMEGAAAAGYGTLNEEFPEVFQKIDMAEWKVRQQLGFIPTTDRVKLLTVRGDSHYPKIKDGDVVMVDTDQTAFSGDGFYLISLNGFGLIKRMQIMSDGMHLISTNKEYASEVVPADKMHDIKIEGRIVGCAQLRRSEEI